MTFDDFCAIYVCFKDKKDDEIGQVVFQILRLNPNFMEGRHNAEEPLLDQRG